MYRYDEFDAQLVKERVTQFRGQVQRRLAGQLTDEQFKPLRLMNGLYLQLHAYMLRIAIPYGTLSSRQLRMLAHIARKYDKGYGHFTTRQNIQFNWPALVDVPEILEDLASVEMHCMQTSGNCIRNVTSDQYAGVAREEIEDPRPWCEVIRQWSTLHPEFSYLPRKFKIAVTGCAQDRAAIRVHDIGIAIVRNETQEIGFQIFVGGGQGRTPMIAVKVRDFLPQEDLLPYLEAIMRVYNRYGRRDNLHKARVKILVHALGEEETRRQVEEEFAALPKATIALPQAESERIRAYFAPPPYETLEDEVPQVESLRQDNPEFKAWWENNTAPHKIPGYVIVNISLKPIEGVAGDADAQQMDAIADMADTFSHGEVRVTHEQNLTLPFVRKTDTPLLWKELQAQGLATPNIALITDQIVCPGLDYCNLANARSISVAQRLSDRFRTQTRQQEIGELKIKISGCMNACGHHHVGHIGILGVDKKGQEYYQLLLGGSADENAALGKITGAAFTEEEIVDAVERVVEVYLEHRRPDEKFLDTYNRLGLQPLKTLCMPLLRGGAFVEDDWRQVIPGESLSSGEKVLLSWEDWREARKQLLKRAEESRTELGVRFPNTEDPALLEEDLKSLSLIALEFPTFRDGRAYSQARLLRQRYGFQGELRACGDVLRDQWQFMHRCGFDAFEVQEGTTLQDWQEALGEISMTYQTPSGAETIVALRSHRRDV